MPDSPDFDQIARDAIDRWGGDEAPIQRALIVEDIAVQLRQVWNARGAADGQALKAELQRVLDLGPQPEASRPTINLEQMIKALDR